MRKLIFFLFFIPAFLSAHIFDGYLPAKWMIDQINEDLQSITPSDLDKDVLYQALHQKYPYAPHLIHFKIQNNKLIVLGTIPEAYSFKSRFLEIKKQLEKLVQNIPPLQCEFILSLLDEHPNYVTVPIFCFCKKKDTSNAILIPDCDCFAGEKKLKAQVNLGNYIFPWEKKINQAFWRGSTTGGRITLENYQLFPRFQLVEQSLKYPEWVNARFTNLVLGAEHLKSIYSPYMGKPKTIIEHLKYKYQILVDGNTCAWSRAYWQLFSNSVIIKKDSDYIQWYYKGLQPYVHYIPAASDFHNLIDQIEWAQSHDQEAFQISLNAQEFANENLNHKEMLYYIYLLLCRYSEIQSDCKR